MRSTIEIIPLICSIRYKLYKFNFILVTKYIYHAAAYKHVPIVEHNLAGLKNNVFGTLTIAKLLLKQR